MTLLRRLPCLLLPVLASGATACSGPRAPAWQEADGYRWTELEVPRRGTAGFRQLTPRETGITFTNSATEAQVLENEHVLNGSGVALGDVDGDGRTDIFLSRLDGPNALYRNLGGWKFEDVTERAGVGAPDWLTTGAVFADIDGDGDVDLLLTTMGGPNALFINDGDGVFTEETQQAGLASGYYGTTMTLADVDGDRDLDLYVANNKLKSVRDLYPPWELAFDRVVEERDGRFTVRPGFREHYRLVPQGNRIMRFEYAEPDKFYLNDGSGRFEELSFTDGRFLDADGQPLSEVPTDWALTARFYDMDRDGDPDLYVCNDFESPDHVWMNDGSGRFRMIDRLALRSTSNANMAIDFADIDRDGDVDFFELDMLDMSSGGQKTQTPAMAPEPRTVGEIETRPQLPRNSLFVNRGDGTYAEAAYYAGLEASGWSWSVIFLDVDLDGFEDLIIGNGHARDFLDSDTKGRTQNLRMSEWRRIRLLYPELHLPNVAYRNLGDLTFERVDAEWGLEGEPDIAQGAAAGDLDGDGDLDVIMNRLDSPAAVLRNESARPRVAVRLRGRSPNTQGVGAVIYLAGGPVPLQQKEVAVGGLYLSSSDPVYTFAAGDADSLALLVRWRTGLWSHLPSIAPNRLYEIDEDGAVERGAIPDAALPHDNPAAAPLFTDVSGELAHSHTDEEYDDFRRQPLLPNRLSQLGPGVTWADVDRDGDEDLMVGSGVGGRLAFYRNDSGRLKRIRLRTNGARFDQTGILPLPDGRGQTALLVGTMNYEAESPAAAMDAASVEKVELRGIGTATGAVTPRISSAVPGIMSSTGPLAMADYDGDGDLDLFVGGRVLPARYPAAADSRLLRNEAGALVADPQNSRKLSQIGLVSSAVFSDVDGDGDPDLLLALEWGSLKLFRNDGGVLADVTAEWGLASTRSRWNGVTTGDLDGDGRLDIVATSWGGNSALKAAADRPQRVYYGDLDGNGRFDVVTARFDPRVGDIVPLAGRVALTQGIPVVARSITSFVQYADATLEEALGPLLSRASILEVTTFEHAMFFNRGSHFERQPLPWAAQLAPSFYAGVADFDGDGFEDVLLTQNFFATDPGTQRLDAGRGLLLIGDGDGGLVPMAGQASGITVYGDQRGAAFADYNGDGRLDVVVSQNGAATKLYRNEGGRSGLRVRLLGPAENPDAVGALIRIQYRDRLGPGREIHGGSGYWSHDGPVQVLGLAGEPTGVVVRWPGGYESTTAIKRGAREVTISLNEPAAEQR